MVTSEKHNGKKQLTPVLVLGLVSIINGMINVIYPLLIGIISNNEIFGIYVSIMSLILIFFQLIHLHTLFFLHQLLCLTLQLEVC